MSAWEKFGDRLWRLIFLVFQLVWDSSPRWSCFEHTVCWHLCLCSPCVTRHEAREKPVFWQPARRSQCNKLYCLWNVLVTQLLSVTVKSVYCIKIIDQSHLVQRRFDDIHKKTVYQDELMDNRKKTSLKNNLGYSVTTLYYSSSTSAGSRLVLVLVWWWYDFGTSWEPDAFPSLQSSHYITLNVSMSNPGDQVQSIKMWISSIAISTAVLFGP